MPNWMHHGSLAFASLVAIASAALGFAQKQPDGGYIFTHNERNDEEMAEAASCAWSCSATASSATCSTRSRTC